MLILGLETSCDETAIAILDIDSDNRATICAEKLSSQIDLHALYGGVVPELAAREHLKNLPIVLDLVLTESGLALEDMDCIAVTQGPGLKGCLLMGMSFAKALHVATDIPLVGVNHIEGHALAPLLDNPEMPFPTIALIVSGGHTEIQLMHAPGKYELIERTIDDAAGEAFDKSANLLGFDYPGGAALAKLADDHGPSSFSLPKVMREAPGFSFSGLKTAISLLIKKNLNDSNRETVIPDLSSAVQSAIIDALVFKVKRAVEKTGVKSLAVTGGVAANKALRAALGKIPNVDVYFPTSQHCTDNGAMIAFAGYQSAKQKRYMNIESDVYSRWPLETMT